MKTKKGFTLIELLVVIAVIALLMAMLMPALRKAKEHAMRVICGNHVRQIVVAITIYGDKYANMVPAPGLMGQPWDNEQENKYAGKVPEPVIPGAPDDHYMGNWPWDGRYGVVNEILKCMGKNISDFKIREGEADPIPPQNVFYCPANVQQKRFLPTNWSYAIGLNDGRPDGYRVLGFAFLWACSWNYQGTMRIRGGLKETDPADPTKKWVTRTDMPQASTVEMVVDTVMSERQDTTKAYDLTKYPDGNFAQIFSGGNDELYGTPDQTSHLVSDKKAAGGNIGFVDGHVEWRNFKDMRNRIGPGGVGPMWWW